MKYLICLALLSLTLTAEIDSQYQLSRLIRSYSDQQLEECRVLTYCFVNKIECDEKTIHSIKRRLMEKDSDSNAWWLTVYAVGNEKTAKFILTTLANLSGEYVRNYIDDQKVMLRTLFNRLHQKDYVMERCLSKLAEMDPSLGIEKDFDFDELKVGRTYEIVEMFVSKSEHNFYFVVNECLDNFH